MDAPVQYMEELRSDLALYPTWLPFDRIELGAYGTIKRGKFFVDGRLGEDFDIDVVPKLQPADGSFRKSRGVKFSGRSSTHASAGLVDASLGVDVHFEREHAWVFAPRGMSSVEIANIAEVRRVVLDAHKRGDWQPEWLLVTEYRQVDVLNVLIARSKNVGVRVAAKGTLAAADVLIGEDVAFELQTDDVFAVKNQKNTTPLYGLRKVQGWFRPGLKPVSRDSRAPEPSLEVANDEPLGFA